MAARLGLLAAAGVLVAVALVAARRYRRYEITGASMLPALRPGDWVIVDRAAFRGRVPRPGEIAVALDPRTAERTIVKRVDAIDGSGVRLLGDNAAASTDSRTLGAFPLSLLTGRVRWRYWPPPLGAVR